MANDRKIGVSLEFNANTSQAKAALQDLQNSLSRLTNDITTGKTDLPITKSITQAISETSKLQAILKSSTTSMGTLDLGQFRNELNKAGMSAKTVSNTLSNLGPEGIKAFGQLTQSVITAEVPLKRTNTLLTNFATTLKNTAKWQISSSILHGFMGSIQKAYGYAKNLNESLNNIRIVTGQSTQQMTDFAKQANKAAKELSTTTTAYTDAALIFYQQGLTGDAVTERTNTVIKMSNVTGQSAEEVSSYMTAIWNNFDDGSESLEHYADVITALGASTASSSREIAEGLEKFAAIGDTVGLSYEYATTALATVVAQTRQSADTVGTAFKTLFARIQDLELGETLDDGTTLGKYSQALATIGVNIKDASGQVKDMDQILDEMGSKWQTVSKDTQIAVAQAVAGTRQYSQLVALMDNWGEFQNNLNVANNSDGSLQQQADIYAQSWDAARDRVRASMETIYSSLLDDEFFIKLTNGFADLLGGIKEVIDRFGGLKNIVPLVGAALMNAFGPTLAKNIDNFAYNLQNTESKALQFKETFLSSFSNFDDNSIGFQVMKDSATDLAEAMSTIIQRQETLNKLGLEYSDVEKMSHNYIIENIKKLNEKREQQAEILRLAQEEAEQTKKVLVNDISNNFKRFIAEGSKSGGRGKGYATEATKERAENQAIQQHANLQNQLKDETSKPKAEQDKEKIAQLNEELEKCKQKIKEIQETPIAIKIPEDAKLAIEENLAELDKMGITIGSTRTALESYNLSEKEGTEAAAQLIKDLENLQSGFEKSTEASGIFDQALNEIRNNNAAEGMKKVEKALEILEQESLKVSDGLLDQIENLNLTEEQYKGLSNILEQYKKKLEAVGTAEANLGKTNKEAKDTVDGLRKSIKDANSQAQDSTMSIGSFISTSAGALMNFGSVISSVNSLINQLSDPDLSGWQKFTTVLTSGSMAVMMLSNGIGSAIKLYSSFTPTINAAKVALMGFNTQEELKEFLTRKNIAYTEQETLAQLKQKAATELQSKSLLKLIATKIKHIATTIIEKIVTGDLKTIILTGLVVAFTALIAVMSTHTARLKENAKNTKNFAEASTKTRENLEKEAEEVNKLNDAYKQLKDKYEDNNLSLSQLRNQTYSLCLQYGEQKLAIKALTASYSELNDMMSEVSAGSASKIAAAAKEEQNYYKDAVLAQLKVTAGSRLDWDQYIDLKGMEWRNSENDALEEALESLYSSTGGYGTLFYDNDYIDIEKFTELALDNREELEKILNTNTSDATDQLKEYLGDISELLDGYDKATESFKENSKKNIIATNSQNIKSFKDYQNAIAESTKEALYEGIFNGEDAAKKAREWAQSAMAAIDKEFSAWSQKSIIIDNIVENVVNPQDGYSKIKDYFEEQYKGKINRDVAINQYLDEVLKDPTNVKKLYTGLKDANYRGLGYEQSFSDAKGLKTDGKLLTEWADEVRNRVIRVEINEEEEDILFPDTVEQIQNYTGIQFLPDGESLEEFTAEKLRDELDKLNIAELNFLYNNTEKLKYFLRDQNNPENAFIDFVEQDKYKESIENYGKKLGYDYMSNVLLGMTEKGKKLTKKEVHDLFKNLREYGLEDALDVGEYSFNNATYEAQQGILLEAQFNNLKNFDEIKKDNIKNAEEEKKAFLLNNDYEKEEKFLEDIDESIYGNVKNIDLSNTNNKITTEQKAALSDKDAVDAIMEKIAASDNQQNPFSEEKLSENEKLIYEALKAAGILNGDVNNDQSNAKDYLKNKELADSYNEVAEGVANAKNETANYDEAIKENEEHSKIANSNLDNIQSSYKTLTAAIKQYNKDGHFTLDNLQAILDLGPQYLQYLQKTENGYKLNKNAIVELTKANILNDMYDRKRAANALILKAQSEDQVEKDKALAEMQQYVAINTLFTASSFEVLDEKIANGNPTIVQYIQTVNKALEAEKEFLNSINITNIDEILGSKSSGSKRDKKLYEDEFNRYRDIEEAIEDLEDALSDLDKMQSHVFGNALIQSLEKQNELLDKQKEKYEELFEMQKINAGELQGALSNYGLEFASNGDILNYDEITRQMVEKHNSNLSNEKVGKEYETFKTLLEKYESLTDEIDNTLNTLDDIYYKQIENNLEAFETKIQLKLDLKDVKKEWNEFIKNINEDFKLVNKNISKEFDFLIKQSNIYGGKDGIIATRIDAMNSVMREIDKMQMGQQSSLFVSISEAQEKLKEYLSDFENDAENFYDLVNEAWDNYIEGIDQAIDKLDDLMDQYERIESALDHQSKIIELLYGKNAYDYLNTLYDAQILATEGQLDSLQTQIDFYEEQYYKAVKKYGADSEAAEKWKDAWENAVDELYDKEEQHIEQLLKKYENTVDKTFSDLEKRLTGGSNFDWIREQWDLSKAASEGYYDSIQRIYQLESMETKWENALSKASTLKAQQKLKGAMQAQMEILQSKTKLTEYDVKLAEKRLAVAQAEAALEDARNNKNAMKLSRGADGNWSYQYVADEDDLASKQQGALDAASEAYNFTKDNLSQINETIMEDTAAWTEAIKEIQLQMATATEEEKVILQQRLDFYNEYYSNKLKDDYALRNQMVRDMEVETTSLLLTEYNADIDNFNFMTTEQQRLFDEAKNHNIASATELYTNTAAAYGDIADSALATCKSTIEYWNTAAFSIIERWSTNDDSVKNEVLKALNVCQIAQETYTKIVTKLYGDIELKIDNINTKTKNLAPVTSNSIQSISKTLGKYESNLDKVSKKWQSMKNDIIKASAAANTYLEIISSLTGLTHEINIEKIFNDTYDALTKAGDGDIDTFTGNGKVNEVYGWDESVNKSYYLTGTKFTVSATDKTVGEGAEKTNIYKIENEKGGHIYITEAEYKSFYKDKENVIKTFATGGYTGEWNSGDGRLAVLHSKELVLNAEDTENMLAAVDSVRKISSISSSIGKTISNGIGNMVSSLLGLNNNTLAYAGSSISNDEHNVFNITAEFPAADSVDTIREAILGLPNLVSQYVNRK